METLRRDGSGDGQDDYRIRWFRGDKDVTKRSPSDRRVRSSTFGRAREKTFKATIKAEDGRTPARCASYPFFTVHNDVIGDYSYGRLRNDDGVYG